MQGYGVMSIKSSTNKEYLLYYSGNNKKSENGVGIIVPKTKNVEFAPINDRICIITTKVNNNQMLHIISAYATTLDKSEKQPETREKFYSDIDSIIRKHKSRHITIIVGDFNAKIGKHNDNLNHLIIGKYGKGIPNNNGNHLLNFATINNLKITNTFFKHKLSQRTTWESPNAKHKNQVGYILVKNSKGIQIEDSRSYGGTVTNSDHKMVITKCIFKWPYTRKNKKDPEI